MALTKNEQDEVATQNTHSSQSGIFSSRTVAHRVLLHSPLRVGPVIVRSKEDDKEVNDELNDLRHSDGLLPGHSNTQAGKGIVGVCKE